MKILVIDIETTNFLNRGGKILEIGATEVDLEKKELTVKFDQQCFEFGMAMTEITDSWIAHNSNILSTYYDKRRFINEVFKDLRKLVDEYRLGVTAYNSKFDFEFLESYGFEIENKLPCLMHACTNIVKARHKNGRRGYKWPSVEESYRHFFPNENYKEAHRGADDSFHEAKIALKLYELGILKF